MTYDECHAKIDLFQDLGGLVSAERGSIKYSFLNLTAHFLIGSDCLLTSALKITNDH